SHGKASFEYLVTKLDTKSTTFLQANSLQVLLSSERPKASAGLEPGMCRPKGRRHVQIRTLHERLTIGACLTYASLIQGSFFQYELLGGTIRAVDGTDVPSDVSA
ncbi:MAG: hypothetical protein ACLQVL_22775, partial [Terriglobia bacterium]